MRPLAQPGERFPTAAGENASKACVYSQLDLAGVAWTVFIIRRALLSTVGLHGARCASAAGKSIRDQRPRRRRGIEIFVLNSAAVAVARFIAPRMGGKCASCKALRPSGGKNAGWRDEEFSESPLKLSAGKIA